jgi:hypothetical protein
MALTPRQHRLQYASRRIVASHQAEHLRSTLLERSADQHRRSSASAKQYPWQDPQEPNRRQSACRIRRAGWMLRLTQQP